MKENQFTATIGDSRLFFDGKQLTIKHKKFNRVAVDIDEKDLIRLLDSYMEWCQHTHLAKRSRRTLKNTAQDIILR